MITTLELNYFIDFASQVVERNTNIGRTVVAEIEHFERTKKEQTKKIFKTFLREQINFQLRPS